MSMRSGRARRTEFLHRSRHSHSPLRHYADASSQARRPPALGPKKIDGASQPLLLIAELAARGLSQTSTRRAASPVRFQGTITASAASAAPPPGPTTNHRTMGKWSLQRRRSHCELPRLHELERAVQAEIRDVRGREELFLRSTSELTSLMKKLGRSQGRAYFRYVLRDVFGERSKLYETRAPHSNAQVCAYAKSIIQRLAKAIHFAPLVLRAGCHYMLTEFRKAFPECKHDARIVVGSLLFLRIICPALIKPEMFDFPAHTAQSLPVGVQIAKILQHTLSGTPVGDSDAAFSDSNAFIYAFQPYVANFLVRFPQIRSAFGDEEPQQQQQQLHVSDTPASWDCSNATPITPTTPTRGASNWPPSPRAESWDARRPNGKIRGLSMSSNDAIKNKRKFSLRFWSRGPGSGGISQRPTP